MDIIKRRQQNNKYYRNNRTKILRQVKEYSLVNKEKIKKYGTKYREEHVEKMNRYSKTYRKKNEGIISLKRKEYYKMNLEKAMLSNARLRALKVGIPFDITEDDIVIPERCPVLGIKLIPGVGKTHRNSPSLDRVIPHLGYIKGNVMVISQKANVMKNDASGEELEAFAHWILG